MTDRRAAYRLALDPGQISIKDSTGLALELRDLSAQGGALVLRGPGAHALALPLMEIDLGDGDTFSTRPEVVTMRAHSDGVLHLGTRWRGVGTTEVHKLARFIAREFTRRNSGPRRLLDRSRALTVQSPVFIRNLLGQLPRSSAQILSEVDRNLRDGAQLRVEAVAFEAGRRVIRARLVGESPAQLVPRQVYKLVLSGSSAVTVFESHCLDQDGADVTLTVPREIRQRSSRHSRRIDVADVCARGGARAPSVTFAHPRIDGALVTGDVIDVGSRGLSFAVTEGEHGLFPDDRLETFLIDVPGRRMRASAIIRSLAIRDDRVLVGVQLARFPVSDDGRAWQRFVFDHIHPEIIDGAGRAAAAWSLLESSRYVDLWTAPESRAAIARQYLAAWQAPHRETGHALLLCRGDRTVGMSAASLAYPRTWLLHHLARDPAEDGEDAQAPLRQSHQLISGLLRRLQDETDLEHFVITFERGKRWNERLYGDFAQRYFDQDKLLLAPMDVYRYPTDRPVPTPADIAADIAVDTAVDIAVDDATPALLALLVERLGKAWSALECRALGLTGDDVTLTGFRDRCAERGHQRARAVFFAHAGAPCMALIADSGGEGVNIFGLLNCCRVVVLAPERDAAQLGRCRQALLARASAHYGAGGTSHFLLFVDPDIDVDIDSAGNAGGARGTHRISQGLRWIAHRDVIPAWSAYLDGLMAAADPAPVSRPDRLSPPQQEPAP